MASCGELGRLRVPAHGKQQRLHFMPTYCSEGWGLPLACSQGCFLIWVLPWFPLSMPTGFLRDALP